MVQICGPPPPPPGGEPSLCDRPRPLGGGGTGLTKGGRFQGEGGGYIILNSCVCCPFGPVYNVCSAPQGMKEVVQEQICSCKYPKLGPMRLNLRSKCMHCHATHMKGWHAFLNSCPASTTTMKTPILWEKQAARTKCRGPGGVSCARRFLDTWGSHGQEKGTKDAKGCHLGGQG